MIDVNILNKYQQRLLDIQSADYKFKILTNNISYINKLVESGEFDFLNISEDLDKIYENSNYFYDYLENQFLFKNKDNNYTGYNKLNINALLHSIPTPNSLDIIHDDIFTNLNNIYKKYFSNISEHSIYNIFYNNFKIDTLNISNYLKVCFDKELDTYNYSIAHFYLLPMYNFSKNCTLQIITAIRKNIYNHILSNFNNNVLHLTTVESFNNNLSKFILKNVFNNYNFNDYYKEIVNTSININKLKDIFNSYIDKLPTNHVFTCINNTYFSFIQEFAYILMTKGRNQNIIKFNIPVDIYSNILFGTNETIQLESKFIIDQLNNNIVPEILFQVNSDVFFIRISGNEYKISRNLTPETFNKINHIVTVNDNSFYNNTVKSIYTNFSEIYSLDLNNRMYSGRLYTKNDLEQKIQTTQFFIPSLETKVIEKNSIFKTLNVDVINRSHDLKSIVNITYKYRKDPLQFINSNLAVFSDWTDLLLETQYNNFDYIPPVTNSDISTIIQSIDFDIAKLLQFIDNNFISHYINSNTIDLEFYNYYGTIVDNFIKTAEFKTFIINDFIEPIASALKKRSPKLYKEIYQNIDNIINYIKFLLVTYLFNTLDLQNKYRDIVISNVFNLNIDQFHIQNIIDKFKDVDNLTLQSYKSDIIKFTTSMSVLFLLDKYIDSFRLIKKFKTFNIVKVEQNKNLITIYLDEPHSLNQGRGITINGNKGNINGYKIVNEILSPVSFSIIQLNASPGIGGFIDIREI